MKIFLLIQENFAIMGISSHQSNTVILATAISSIGFGCAFIFGVAITFKVNIDSIYTNFTLIGITLVFVIFNWRVANFFDFIKDFIKDLVISSSKPSKKICEFSSNQQFSLCTSERNITNLLGLEHPASKEIHEKLNQNVENSSKLIYLVLVKVIPQCMICPKFMANLYAYWAADLANDALELPFPMW